MDLEIRSNAPEVSRWMRAILRDQFPFAVAGAVNAMGLGIQAAQRDRLRRIFKQRNPEFQRRGVKQRRNERATKAKPETVIRIEPPGGARRADILTRHESDRKRTPRRGSSLAVPVSEAVRTDPDLKIRRLRLRRQKRGRVGKGKNRVSQGRERTYAIRYPDGSGLILQRTGSGAKATRVIYTLHTDTALNPKLGFRETAEDYFARKWADHMDDAWNRALATAR